MMKFITILSLLFTLNTTAQTRFYLDRLITAPCSPTLQAAWNVTTGNTYSMMYPSKSKYSLVASPLAKVSGASGAVAPRKMLISTYVSQPLLAQTILTGTVISMQIKCGKNNTLQTESLIVYVRYCNVDGSNVQDIANMSSIDLSTTSTNRTLTVTLGSDVTIAEYQRLIIEIGGNYTVGALTTLTCTLLSNISPITPDFLVDNTETLNLTPWIEFSQTLLFFVNYGIVQ